MGGESRGVSQITEKTWRVPSLVSRRPLFSSLLNAVAMRYFFVFTHAHASHNDQSWLSAKEIILLITVIKIIALEFASS